MTQDGAYVKESNFSALLLLSRLYLVLLLTMIAWYSLLIFLSTDFIIIHFTILIHETFILTYLPSLSHHSRQISILLILLLFGNVENNYSDVTKCVCLSTEESELMLKCESCLCWFHTDCVNILTHVVDNFPFICSFWLSYLSLISNLRSEILWHKTQIIKLLNFCKSFSFQVSESWSAQIWWTYTSNNPDPTFNNIADPHHPILVLLAIFLHLLWFNLLSQCSALLTPTLPTKFKLVPFCLQTNLMKLTNN